MVNEVKKITLLMLRNTIFAVILFLFFLTSVAIARTTYNKCGTAWSTGSNSNGGTSKSTPRLTIEYAAENAASGDTIIVGDGTYNDYSTVCANYVMLLKRCFTDWVTFSAEYKWGAYISASANDNGAIN